MGQFIINSNLAAKIKYAAERGASAERICNFYRMPSGALSRVQTWVDKYAPKPKVKTKVKTGSE